MQQLLIINADDFGYSSAVNYGIIDSHLKGVLTSATIMAGMPGYEHAVALAKAYPSLAVGVHLTLTCGAPVLNTHQKIVDQNGMFFRTHHDDTHHLAFDADEIDAELRAQIDRVIASGIKPSHLDSHHHFHKEEVTRKIVWQIARDYNLPIRWGFPDLSIPDDLVTTDFSLYDFDHCVAEWMNQSNKIRQEQIQQFIDNFIQTVKQSQAKSVELMTHPAFLDAFLNDQSSMAAVRPYEVETLIAPYFKQALAEAHIKLATFNDLVK